MNGHGIEAIEHQNAPDDLPDVEAEIERSEHPRRYRFNRGYDEGWAWARNFHPTKGRLPTLLDCISCVEWDDALSETEHEQRGFKSAFSDYIEYARYNDVTSMRDIPF